MNVISLNSRCLNNLYRLLSIAFLSFLVSFSPLIVGASENVVSFGFSSRVPNVNEDLLIKTKEALESHFGKDRIRIAEYSLEGMERAIKNGEVDVFLSSAGLYRRLTSEGVRDLVALASPRFPDPNRSEGTAFIVRKDRSDLQTIKDLKGKVLAANSHTGFSGYQIGLYEIYKAGFDPENFFSKEIFTGEKEKMIGVVKAVLSGKADVGFLRLCYFEDMIDPSEVNKEELRIISDRKNQISCSHSTDLYPSWTISTTRHISPAQAKEVLQVLLAIPPTKKGAFWGLASDYHGVDSLFKDLKLGPWSYLREWTLKRIFNMYWPFFALALICIIGLIAHSLRTEILVRRKTEELQVAHLEQTELLQKAREATEYLESLQKMGAIGQMSSIISHELRQPLATIQMYVRGALRLIEKFQDRSSDNNGAKLINAFELIDKQCLKMEQIIEKVRNHAKQKKTRHELIDAADVTQQAIDNFRISKNAHVHVDTHLGTDCFIWADTLELELVVVNLLRNASEAQSSLEEPLLVNVTRKADRVEISITDQGEILSDEELKKLQVPLISTKENGMGLGLTIVKTIVEAHQGRISFKRNKGKGLTVTVSFIYAGGERA